MILRIIKHPLLLAACAALSSALAYGQATIVPVVPPDSVGPGESRPFSWVVVPADGSSTVNLVHAPGQTSCGPSNACYYFESDIWTAYGLPPLQNRGHYGQGITIAIVDAFYDPQIAQNLVNFSNYFHLPGGTVASSITCTSAPTLTVVNQTGGSPASVAFNAGWAEEANLDVQQAHAMAPCANILLIAANNNSDANLFPAVQYAYAHADLVSNSYGGGEFANEPLYDAFYFAGSTVPLLFSSGDTGAVTEYPCSGQYSTCVGGTTLYTTPTSFRTQESAWESGGGGSGGGCSYSEPQPGYEAGFTNADCGSARGVPDVAALADPYTGVIIGLGSDIGIGPTGVYCCIGGTSLAAPLTTGVLANVDAARVALGKAKLGGDLNSLLYPAASYSPNGASVLPAPYGNAYRSFYFDVFTGNTGFPATMYWDKTTGLGVPYFGSLGNYLISTVP